ncbi:MAG: penicillin-binding protein 2 [Planctomycetes bacterium]|jgi:penicillin-binding protein 2|nr:penicillin-binding protein 2 [Planctomycetota bacterium]
MSLFWRSTKKKTVDSSKKPFIIREGKFSFSKLEDSFYRTDWVEHSFIMDNGEKEAVGTTFEFKKIIWLIVILSIGFILLFSRIIWLQIIKHNYYYALAEENRLRIEELEPKRGVIYDRNKRALVNNKPNFFLYLIPASLPAEETKRDDILKKIDSLINNPDSNKVNYNNQEIDVQQYKNTELVNSAESDIIKNTQIEENNSNLESVLTEPILAEEITNSFSFSEAKNNLSKALNDPKKIRQPLFLIDHLDYQTALSLSINLDELPGVFLTTKSQREYLNNDADGTVLSLSHIFGYVGKINEKELKDLGTDYSFLDYVGKVGLERYWEKDLRGKKGERKIEMDALGKERKIVSETLPEDGHNLTLSLDFSLQKKIEEIVKNNLTALNLKKASVIVLDPRNGEVLALLSWPAYNNNIFARGIKFEEYQELLNNPDKPLFNRVVSGNFPSGSTLKPVIAAAALQENIITAATTFLSSGGIKIDKWNFPDWKAGGHGLTDVKKALAESVNTFFYFIGGGYQDFTGLGLEKMIKYVELFGLGEKTGLDLSGEVEGFVPTRSWKEEVKKEKWYIGDTYHFAIGQGDILTTPLQIANFTAAIANGGYLLKPHLVKEVSAGDKILQTIKGQVIRKNFVSAKNLEIVRAGMRQAVTDGSARRLNGLSVAVAGKTGTAQWSSKANPQAWFTGFAPYNNPEIVITVLVEEGGEGSVAAVPIAQEIFQYYFNRKD